MHGHQARTVTHAARVGGAARAACAICAVCIRAVFARARTGLRAALEVLTTRARARDIGAVPLRARAISATRTLTAAYTVRRHTSETLGCQTGPGRAAAAAATRAASAVCLRARLTFAFAQCAAAVQVLVSSAGVRAAG